MSYWLKEEEFKLATISWGRDDEDPFYFNWLSNGIEFTIKGRRLIIELTLKNIWHTLKLK